MRPVAEEYQRQFKSLKVLDVAAWGLKRIGHKGADSILPGNTLESFEAAVAAGVEMIELDVLRPRAEFLDGRLAPGGGGAGGRGAPRAPGRPRLG